MSRDESEERRTREHLQAYNIRTQNNNKPRKNKCSKAIVINERDTEGEQEQDSRPSVRNDKIASPVRQLIQSSRANEAIAGNITRKEKRKSNVSNEPRNLLKTQITKTKK